MFTVDLTFGAALYTVLGVFLIGGLWVWSDRRDRTLYDKTRRRTTFHCLKCDKVYTRAAAGEVTQCPDCGHENTRLKF